METPPAAAGMMKGTDLAFARCECCGLTEECTEEYIRRVRERYSGRWICGLCAEAVKDEIVRSEKRIGNEEALNQHMSFCKKFKNLSPPKNPTEELICAVKQLLLRSLDSPRSSPVKKPGLVRSQSCRPALDSGCLKMN
ncbi:hypothetical protein CDL12_05695 [Handroanthus impetiginosus]|uniref:DUF1677 domain-containing protein n=1 Tax=Handroanthus impetiginosus TaxID=429701 RepID=A0A2G9HVR8_9LAMI|nr:hypothetical protein CDL12_05695 [Handroanthus impetiginosus]